MPLLSELSRRLGMLTTDAKPDPPRIEIRGYTHNLEPTEDEKKKNSRSVPVTPKDESEKDNVGSSERNESVLNDAIPTGANHSFTKQNIDDTDPFSTDEKPHKGPNVKTKRKSKGYKYTQGTNVVSYNIINSNGVKIGRKTNYICNINQFPTKNTGPFEEAWPKTEVRPMPRVVECLCTSTEEITLEDIMILKTYMGRGWRDVARRLLYSDGQIDQFEENYRFKGIGEVVYQIFLDWKQANTKDAEIGKLVNVLWTCQEYDCAERLVSARKSSK